ncbi:MAG: hypothetical protein ACOYK8_05710 [Alphaproteobacteria bacterium]
MLKNTLAASAAWGIVLFSPLVSSMATASEVDIKQLRTEIQGMKQSYETRIKELEAKLYSMENSRKSAQTTELPSTTKDSKGNSSKSDNAFNPAIGVVLNGQYASFSNADSNIKGFSVPEEGARGSEGLKIGESELNLSANIDNKFKGRITTSFVNEDGEDGVEIEEAFIQTLSGAGLPQGMSLKAGRALWTLGYLNEQHAHNDDFADRPLPYRVFLNKSYNDDGAEVSYVLPLDFYTEIGGGIFRGDDYPFGNASGAGKGAWSGFGRVGGDIGENQNWRLGAYVLSGDTAERKGSDDVVKFSGDTTLYATDLRYSWAPTGNAKEQELLLQAEYFWRKEKGTYEDSDAATGAVGFDGNSSGWYAQTVYKFDPKWRVGYRYSQLQSPSTPVGLTGSALDSEGHNPKAHAVMVDWSNSEFSRVRLQYNHENMAKDQRDNQFLVQYIMSLGAHGAHQY